MPWKQREKIAVAALGFGQRAALMLRKRRSEHFGERRPALASRAGYSRSPFFPVHAFGFFGLSVVQWRRQPS